MWQLLRHGRHVVSIEALDTKSYRANALEGKTLINGSLIALNLNITDLHNARCAPASS